MGFKSIVSTIIILVILLGVVILLAGGFGKNDDQNWQIKQSIMGDVEVIDTPGYYLKMFASVWTWPRAHMAVYNAIADEGDKADESIRVTFNDGGTAQISAMVRFQLPTRKEDRRKFHRDFGGSMKNAISSVKAHLINCSKAAAPLMSSSEHQTARKAEFAQIIEDMLRNGLYKMRKVKRELLDKFDENGRPITIYATEIISGKDGMPIVVQISPLKEYNIKILQFSITNTNYDKETRKQFAAKKGMFLEAEKSKAEREKQVQKRLMIVERGKAEMAEITAQANKVKERVTIEAQQKVDVAIRAKKEAETKANMALEVAKIKKMEAEIEANMGLEVAKINVNAAKNQAIAMIKLAEAKQKQIQLAGYISEKDRVLAQIEADKQTKIASFLRDVQTPSMIFMGGENGGGGTTLPLLNIALMKASGILPADFSITNPMISSNNK